MIWRQVITEDGKVYYYDSVSMVTSWDRPEHFEDYDGGDKVSNECKTGLVDNYSSLDDEDEVADEDELADMNESEVNRKFDSKEKNGMQGDMNVNIAPITIKEIEQQEVGSDQIQEFFKVFDKYGVDPYSSWGLQARKINHDPVFYTIESDTVRQELFEKWCVKKLSEGDIESEEDISFLSDELDLTRYHYLAHIVSKATITQKTVYSDIRKENKELFKKLHVDEGLRISEQKQFVSQTLFYYKRMNLIQRENIFIGVLKPLRASILKNLEDNEAIWKIIEQETSSKSAYKIESQLLEMEKCIGIHGTLSKLQRNEKYYVLGIKDKTRTLKGFLQGLKK